MASDRRVAARNTILIGLAFLVPSLALAIATYAVSEDLTLFTALALPIVLLGGAITWLGTFDWIVSRGAEVVKATNR